MNPGRWMHEVGCMNNIWTNDIRLAGVGRWPPFPSSHWSITSKWTLCLKAHGSAAGGRIQIAGGDGWASFAIKLSPELRKQCGWGEGGNTRRVWSVTPFGTCWWLSLRVTISWASTLKRWFLRAVKLGFEQGVNVFVVVFCWVRLVHGTMNAETQFWFGRIRVVLWA